MSKKAATISLLEEVRAAVDKMDSTAMLARTAADMYKKAPTDLTAMMYCECLANMRDAMDNVVELNKRVQKAMPGLAVAE